MTEKVITMGDHPRRVVAHQPSALSENGRLRGQVVELAVRLAQAEYERDATQQIAVVALAVLAIGCVVHIWRVLA